MSVRNADQVSQEFKTGQGVKAIGDGRREQYSDFQKEGDTVGKVQPTHTPKSNIIRKNIKKKKKESNDIRVMQKTNEICSLDLLLQAASGMEPDPMGSAMETQWQREASIVPSHKQKTPDNSHNLERKGKEPLNTEEDYLDDKSVDKIAVLAEKSPSKEAFLSRNGPKSEEEKPYASNSNQFVEAHIAAPIVSTKRGRAQVLPSRFRDSILEPWKKGNKRPLEDQSKNVPATNKSKKQNKSSPRLLNPTDKAEDIKMSVSNSSFKDRLSTRKFWVHNKSKNPFKTLQNNAERCDLESNTHNGGMCSNGDLNEATPLLSQISSGVSSSGHTSSIAVAALSSSINSESNDEVSLPSVSRTEATAGFKNSLENFYVGDIVWARSGKRNDPAWPAKVVDPLREAPESVRKAFVAGRLCVMFFGPSSSKGRDRVYTFFST
jgi:hypothetical protein